jgi:hypothetical protein
MRKSLAVRRLVLAAVVAMAVGAALLIGGYVDAGGLVEHRGGRQAESRSRLDPAMLGTLPPRAVNILRTELGIDAAVVVRADRAHRGSGGDPAPGVSAGVAALARPAEAPVTIPQEVRRFVEHMARMTRTDPTQALGDLRVLRSGLGSGKASIYAFRSTSGSPCFILTGYGGTCAQDPRDGMPGLHWTIGGGHDSSPSVLVGIASDDVRRVELRVDGVAVPVSLVRNAIFAEFPASAKQAAIAVVHQSGAKSETTFGL